MLQVLVFKWLIDFKLHVCVLRIPEKISFQLKPPKNEDQLAVEFFGPRWVPVLFLLITLVPQNGLWGKTIVWKRSRQGTTNSSLTMSSILDPFIIALSTCDRYQLFHYRFLKHLQRWKKGCKYCVQIALNGIHGILWWYCIVTSFVRRMN